MKKLILCGAVAVALCGCSDPDKLEVSDNGTEFHYISKKSINKQESTALYYVENRKDRLRSIIKIKFDCDNLRFKPLEFKLFNDNDNSNVNLSAEQSKKPTNWIYTEPGSIGRNVVVRSCFPDVEI